MIHVTLQAEQNIRPEGANIVVLEWVFAAKKDASGKVVEFAVGDCRCVVSLNISMITVHVEDYLLKMPPDTQLLCLNCFVDGDQPNQTFTVKIPKTDNVSTLRTHIKLEKAHRLENVDASDLDLFLVSESFLIDDLASRQPPSNGTSLRPNKRLSSLFAGDLLEDDLHIWVKAPLGMSPRYSLSNHL